jgi:hypothetical protein
MLDQSTDAGTAEPVEVGSPESSTKEPNGSARGSGPFSEPPPATSPGIVPPYAFKAALGLAFGEQIAERVPALLDVFGADPTDPLDYLRCGVLLECAVPPDDAMRAPICDGLSHVELSDSFASIRLEGWEALRHPLLRDWIGDSLADYFANVLRHGETWGFAVAGAPRSEVIVCANVMGRLSTSVRQEYITPEGTITAVLHYGPPRPAPIIEPEADPAAFVIEDGVLRGVALAMRAYSQPNPEEAAKVLVASFKERAGELSACGHA